jgi:kynurenine 3-monooxygenase
MTQVTVLGAGCTGPLLALLLTRRGHDVTVYERRPDARQVAIPAGRSINLALASRGIRALEHAGLMDTLGAVMVPMSGRRLHVDAGPTRFIPYGQQPHERLWSVSRAALSAALVTAAERVGVRFRFEHACQGADFQRGVAQIQDLREGVSLEVPIAPLFAADGAGSALREAMTQAGLARERVAQLAHAYKELTIPPDAEGRPRLEPDALHIWPRGGFMLIALPNRDASFTATLFLDRDGRRDSFATLRSPEDARAFFEREFPDALARMPAFDAEFASHPIGSLATVYAEPWSPGPGTVLVGDAAHAIVPFHGQGMNCAFEDCLVLDGLLAADPDLSRAIAAFDATRRVDTDAIAHMALANYTEMRDTVREPRFVLQKDLSLALERRHPGRFVPRYSMVMFHPEIPYSVALERGAIQQRILDHATASAASLAEIDWDALDAEVLGQLGPLETMALPPPTRP